MKTYKAIDLMYAVHAVYLKYSNRNTTYAASKTNNFLNRCGVNIEQPKEQPVSLNKIKEIAYAMLDENAESELFIELNKRSDNNEI
jgi:hypothetical protein